MRRLEAVSIVYGFPHDMNAPDAAETRMPVGLLPLLTLLIFVVVMDGRVMTTMLPEIADDLDSSVSATGFALTAYLLAYGVFQLAYGPLADRVGAMRVMSVACVVFVVVLAAGAVVPGLGGLVAVRLLTGAVAAAFFPLALATVGNLVSYDQRQAAIGTLLAAVALGQVLGAAVGGLVTAAVSWRAMFVIDAALAAALILPLWRYRGSVSPTASSGDPLAGHRRLLRDRRAMLLCVIVLVEGAAFFGGTGYLGALLHDEYGVGLAGVGLILMLDGAAIFVTSRLIGRIAPLLGEARLILVGGGLMGAGFLVALAFGRWEAAIPAVIALGAGFALCHTTLQTRATELDPAARGTAISLFAFALFAGSALGTALLGLLLEVSGYDAVLLASGSALLVLAALAPRLTAPPAPLEPAIGSAGR
jgi:predicted MFS family arabinose efflux permease